MADENAVPHYSQIAPLRIKFRRLGIKLGMFSKPIDSDTSKAFNTAIAQSPEERFYKDVSAEISEIAKIMGFS